MHVENITSNAMSLDRNGQSMLIQVYEKEIDRLNKEYERIYNENCKLRENHNINDITLLDENERLNNIINYIWQVFENGSFEDGCDCIKIYDYLKALKENNK